MSNTQVSELVDHFVLKLLVNGSFDRFGVDLVGLIFFVRIDLLAFGEDGQHRVYHVRERLLANRLQDLDLPDDLTATFLLERIKRYREKKLDGICKIEKLLVHETVDVLEQVTACVHQPRDIGIHHLRVFVSSLEVRKERHR